VAYSHGRAGTDRHTSTLPRLQCAGFGDLQEFYEFWGRGGVSRLCKEPVLFNQYSILLENEFVCYISWLASNLCDSAPTLLGDGVTSLDL